MSISDLNVLLFVLFSAPRFREYAQALINLGADYGVQSIDDIAVSRKR